MSNKRKHAYKQGYIKRRCSGADKENQHGPRGGGQDDDDSLGGGAGTTV